MPLLNRKPFVPERPPANLKADDKLFFIPHTKEVFRDYETYFNRTIHLNSMVWTCAATGRQGLTFEEALESEKSAQVQLDSFPIYLERICLYLASLTCRGKLEDVISDVWLLMKGRFYKGEEVELSGKHPGTIGRVVAVHYDANSTLASGQMSDLSAVSHNGELGNASANASADWSMTLIKSGRKNTVSHIELPAAQCYKYDVELLHEDNQVGVDLDQCQLLSQLHEKMLSRRRSAFTKAKLELYLKQKTYVATDHYAVKPSLIVAHNLKHADWLEFAGGPPPKMPKTSMSKKAQTLLAHKNTEVEISSDDSADGSSGSEDAPVIQRLSSGAAPHLSKEKLAKSQHSKAAKNKDNDKGKVKNNKEKGAKNAPKEKKGKNSDKEKKKAELLAKQIADQYGDKVRPLVDAARAFGALDSELVKWTNTKTLLTDHDLDALGAFVRRKKTQEQARVRELKRLEKERLLEWKKPRDDLLCDDLLPLPHFAPVGLPDWLPDSVFADVIQLLEFFHAYAPMLQVRKFTNRSAIDVDFILAALGLPQVGTEPVDSGEALVPLPDPVLLDAKETCVEEEDGDEADLDNEEHLAKENCDYDNLKFSRAIAESNQLHQRVRDAHNASVRQLRVDATTLGEVLRLHVLTAGYYPGAPAARHRAHRRGGFRCWDDPALHFRMHDTRLLRKLTNDSIFNLSPSDLLELMLLLCGQIMTFSKAREVLEGQAELVGRLRRQLRALRACDRDCDKAAAAARMIHEFIADEERAKNDEKSDETGEGKPENAENGPKIERKTPSKETEKLKGYLRQLREGVPSRRTLDSLEKIIYKESDTGASDKSGVAFDQLELDEIDQVRSMQKLRMQEHEAVLLDKLFDAMTKTGQSHLLGRDRAFRRYWYSDALPGCFVEEESECEGFLGDCEQATPLHKTKDDDDVPLVESDASKVLKGQKLLACTGESGSCPVHAKGTRSARPKWLKITSVEEIDELIGALNPRGFRESELAENLRQIKRRLIEKLPPSRDFMKLLSVTENVDGNAPNRFSVDLDTICRDAVYELHERIYDGGLGTLPGVESVDVWRQSLQGEPAAFDPQVEKLFVDGQIAYANDAGEILPRHKQMAIALLQVAQGIYPKYLKEPFQPSERSLSKTEIRADADRDDQCASISTAGRATEAKPSSEFILWQGSLSDSRSMSAVLLHKTSLVPVPDPVQCPVRWVCDCPLEQLVSWSKSRLQIKCSQCKRKGTNRNMLVCAHCERATHMFCLLPPLMDMPDNSETWLCTNCERTRINKERQFKREIEKERMAAAAEAHPIGNGQAKVARRDSDGGRSSDEAASATGRSNRGKAKRGKENLLDESDQPLTKISSSGRTIKLRSRYDPYAALSGVRKTCARQMSPENSGDFASDRPRRHAAVYDTKYDTPTEDDDSRNAFDETFVNGHAANESEQSSATSASNSNAGSQCAEQSDGADAERAPVQLKRGRGRPKRRAAVIDDDDSDTNVDQSTGACSSGAGDHSRKHDVSLLTSAHLVNSRLSHVDVMRRCHKVLQNAMKQKEAWPFIDPVSMKQVPDYYKVIDKPICLRKILNKLKQADYEQAENVVKDVKLVFENCRTYNLPEAEVYQEGVTLEAHLRNAFLAAGIEYDSRTVDKSLNGDTSQLPSKRHRC